MYECDDVKSGRVKCTACLLFLEDDKCLEESNLTPTYRQFHQGREPSRFEPKQRNTSLVLVGPEGNSIAALEEKSYPIMEL